MPRCSEPCALSLSGAAQTRESETVLDPLFSVLQPNKYLETKITSAIISEEEIADSASPELFEIRRKIRVQESKVRDQLDKMTHSAHYSKFMQRIS